MSNPAWEMLVGNFDTIDVAEKDTTPHALQGVLEDFVDTLSEKERDLFHMRFGEQMPIRKIAKTLGYSSHQVIQVRLARIVEKAREYLYDRNSSVADSDN